MQVMYIGVKEVQCDRNFGTGGVWMGYGDTVDIEDKVARDMIRRHPQVYAEAVNLPEGVIAGTGETGGGGPVPKEVPKEPQDLLTVDDKGEAVTLRMASRASLMRHAREALGYQAPPTATKVELIEQIVRLTALASEGAEAGETPPAA